MKYSKYLLIFVVIILIMVPYYYYYSKNTNKEGNEESEEIHSVIMENIPIRTEVMAFWQTFRGPGNCTANECDIYCSLQENLDQCINWCENNSDLCPDFILEDWKNKK